MSVLIFQVFSEWLPAEVKSGPQNCIISVYLQVYLRKKKSSTSGMTEYFIVTIVKKYF